MTKRVEASNVSMYPQDWAVLDTFAKSAGLSRSAALRIIVREWNDLKHRAMPGSETTPRSEQAQAPSLISCPQGKVSETSQPNGEPAETDLPGSSLT